MASAPVDTTIYARRIGEHHEGDDGLDGLRRRAGELGIETFYWDDRGNYHDAHPESLRRVVDVLEADHHDASAHRRLPPVIVGATGSVAVGPGVTDAQLTLADGTSIELAVGDEHVAFDPPPLGCHTLAISANGVDETATLVVAPDHMPASPALAGKAAVFSPAYALWEEDSPLPSYAHLVSLGRRLESMGVDALITLPLYATFLDEPFDPSPYSPISRLHWNEVYLDDATLPAAPVPELEHLIDWRALGVRRRNQLLEAAHDLDGGLAARVQSWTAANPDIADFARFRAKVAVDSTDAAHPTEIVETSHQLAQYLAHQQLSALRGEGAAAFALDLPIGSHPLGFETWAYPDVFTTGMSIGAPPDSMYTEGQDWGFAPQLPGAAERTGFALWRSIVARCGLYASMLRIDHVLGMHRLWWIPPGMAPGEGVYVRYPRDTLLAVFAAEAAHAGTTVVGEDLGTIPVEMIEARDRWQMLGLYAEETRLGDHDLPAIPARVVAGLRTHDMLPFALLHERGELAAYPAQLERALGRPVGGELSDLLEASCSRLASSPAYLVFADLDDLLGETTPHNIPGKVLPTIWRRRLRRPTSETLSDPTVRRLLATLTARG